MLAFALVHRLLVLAFADASGMVPFMAIVALDHMLSIVGGGVAQTEPDRVVANSSFRLRLLGGCSGRLQSTARIC